MSKAQRAIAIFVLIISGEAIFFLPFVIPRVFRPTYLEVFEVDNFQLGIFFSVFGFVAIPAYLLGGPLADRFPAYKLMSWALLATALGGLFLATIPNPSAMRWLYGFWGMTTILLFWASMMRTTRVLGGHDTQGFAFGLLDGGRGLVAAVVGSIAVLILSFFLGADLLEVDQELRKESFQKVILFFCSIVFVLALVIRWALKPIAEQSRLDHEKMRFKRLKQVLKLPVVWYQSIIIICAYSGYRVADDFSLLAQDVLGYDEVDSAGVGSISLWLRPVAAIGAGLIADKVSTSRMTVICFLLLIIAGLTLGFGPLETNTVAVVFFVIVTTCLGVYALRGLYFAIMEEGKIPLEVTGTAVGLASIIGYLPDIYMAALTGWLIDANPGSLGHRYVFMLLAGFSLVGLFTTLLFRRQVSVR